MDADLVDGQMRPLAFREEYCTAVHKVQEAFSNITLPESDIYKAAVMRALYGEISYTVISLD